MDWQVEVIEWVDPHSVDPWTELKDLELDPCKIISVGQVIKETKSVVVLSLNFQATENNVSCTMIIPKECIKKRRKINVEPRKKIKR